MSDREAIRGLWPITLSNATSGRHCNATYENAICIDKRYHYTCKQIPITCYKYIPALSCRGNHETTIKLSVHTFKRKAAIATKWTHCATHDGRCTRMCTFIVAFTAPADKKWYAHFIKLLLTLGYITILRIHTSYIASEGLVSMSGVMPNNWT